MTDIDRHSSPTAGDQPVAAEPHMDAALTTEPAPQPDPTPAPEPTPVRPDDNFSKLIPIVAVVALGIAWSVAAGTFPVVAFVLAIVAAVMIHETGHFITAKWSGMKVTEYFFGFGPTLWSIRRGETAYGIKALPLGGYVKIIGMSNLERGVDPADEPRTYRQQSYPKRVLVAAAGVVTHFIVAFVLLVLLWTVLGVPRYDNPSLSIGSISRLSSGPTPAVDAGFQIGDRILAVDGQPVAQWDDLPPYIRQHADRAIAFQVERDGQLVNLSATPVPIERDGETVGFIGIGPKPTTERLGPVAGMGRASGDLWRLTTGAVTGLGSIFTPSSISDYADHLTGEPKPGTEGERAVSVIGVVRIAGQAADSGYFNMIYLLVIFNLFVAVLNLVPLLPFDGGHIAVATYERLRSRRGRRYHADVGKLMPLTATVVIVMLTLGVTSIYLDIFRPLANPFQ